MNHGIPQIDAATLEQLFSPSLLVFADRVRSNIEGMIRTAQNVQRLRPHCKTHKMSAVVQLLLQKGVTRHKAATIAEVEMLAEAGARDVVLAYNPVGPNIDRVVKLTKRYPELKLMVTADHEQPLTKLSVACRKSGVRVGVLLDLDVGQHRTGVQPDSDDAVSLYERIAELSNVYPGGFHVYDGHQHQESLSDRAAAVLLQWPKVLELKATCESRNLSVPELLCGGSPTFPIYADLDDPTITLSPGTSVFHDAGYGQHFPDLDFLPAAVVVTRVISRPTADRVTLDLGNKSVAADPPKGQRVFFPDLPGAVQVIHNEEHLVLETPLASQFLPGDVLLGIPTHVCPTSALHREVYVIDEGRLIEPWQVTARDRRITI